VGENTVTNSNALNRYDTSENLVHLPIEIMPTLETSWIVGLACLPGLESFYAHAHNYSPLCKFERLLDLVLIVQWVGSWGYLSYQDTFVYYIFMDSKTGGGGIQPPLPPFSAPMSVISCTFNLFCTFYLFSCADLC